MNRDRGVVVTRLRNDGTPINSVPRLPPLSIEANEPDC